MSPSDHSGRAHPETDLQEVSNIPPPPFVTSPKLQTVEQVMSNYTGNDVASLRLITTALARDAIFGRDALSKCSLSGRENTAVLNQEKLNYIKMLVKSHVPEKTKVEFETLCHASLSKSCQTLRCTTKRRLQYSLVSLVQVLFSPLTPLILMIFLI